MRTFLLFVVLAAVALPLKADESPMPPEGWKEFSPKDKSFTVWLPDKGGRQNERERTLLLRGMRVRFNVVQLELNDGTTLSAGTTILPPTLARRIPMQERIELFRDANVELVKGKIEGEKSLKQGRVPGKEYTISTATGILRLRLYAFGSLIYQSSVSGTKEQAESKQSSDFLESYRLPSLAVDGTRPPNTGTGTGTAPKGKLVNTAATVIPGDLFAYLQSSAKEKRVADADIKGFTLSKNVYREVPEKGGVLIGFNVGLKKFINNDIIGALQPIYLTKDGEATGDWIGPKPAEPISIKAKPGYVVGGIDIRVGLGIDGLALNFMKLDKDRIQVTEAYKSDYVGGPGGSPAALGGQGYYFVGVYGHLNDQKTPCSLGLIAVLKPKE